MLGSQALTATPVGRSRGWIITYIVGGVVILAGIIGYIWLGRNYNAGVYYTQDDYLASPLTFSPGVITLGISFLAITFCLDPNRNKIIKRLILTILLAPAALWVLTILLANILNSDMTNFLFSWWLQLLFAIATFMALRSMSDKAVRILTLTLGIAAVVAITFYITIFSQMPLA